MLPCLKEVYFTRMTEVKYLKICIQACRIFCPQFVPSVQKTTVLDKKNALKTRTKGTMTPPLELVGVVKTDVMK